VSFAFLNAGNPVASAALNLRKAKLIFDLGKHTLRLSSSPKEIESSRGILSRANTLLNQAQHDITESDEPDAVLRPLLNQWLDLSTDMAVENSKLLSKMASMEGLGLDDWRKTLASKIDTAASRKASYEKGFPERATAWSRALRESMAKAAASREQFNIPLLPEEDPIKSFRESIEMALDNARHGESRAAFAHLEKALVKSRTFQNPEFADSVLAMTQWFISKRTEKTLAQKIQSIRDNLSRAMEAADEGDLSVASLSVDYVEKIIASIPLSIRGSLKRLVTNVDRLIHSKAVEMTESRKEVPIQMIHELQLKWSGILTPDQEKKLEKTEKTLKSKREWLQPHLKFSERSKGFHNPKRPKGRVLVFPIEKVLQKIENNLKTAEDILPFNDIKATNLIRRSQDFLQLVVKNAPHWQWNISLPEDVTVTDENVLLYEKSAAARYKEFVHKIGNLADRITALAKQTKTLGPAHEQAMRELFEKGSE
jgi:hypothetical protein